jgi:hypothetical protein
MTLSLRRRTVMMKLGLFDRSRRVVFDGALQVGVDHARKDPICRHWLDVDHDEASVEDLLRSAFVVLSWSADPDATVPRPAPEPVGFALR